MKPGKKEKIRFGKAPQETLPQAPSSQTEDAGAVRAQVAANAAAEPDNPLESNSKPEKKTRFSDRAKLPKQPKPKGPQLDPEAPAAADAAEVADRQAQAGPLGLGGNQTRQEEKEEHDHRRQNTVERQEDHADRRYGRQATGERTATGSEWNHAGTAAVGFTDSSTAVSIWRFAKWSGLRSRSQARFVLPAMNVLRCEAIEAAAYSGRCFSKICETFVRR